MEDATLAALLYDDDTLLPEAMEAPMTSASPLFTMGSAHGTTTSESEDDPMSVEEDEPKKKNKPTYYARRDEIKMLQAELGELTNRMENLQNAKPPPAPSNDVMGAEVLHNLLLKSGLKQTDLTLAGLQSILANYRTMHGRNPLKTYIRLSAEPTQRHQTMAALRDERLREATDFILERLRYLDLCRPYRESEAYELANGDHIVTQCEIEPARTNLSIKEIFDDVMLAILHQEFTVGEALGVTTTLETDSCKDRSYSQSRELITMPDGAQVEKNMAHFVMYSTGTQQLMAPHGLFVIHPIAEDERYPFQPHLRVRQDMTLVILVCPLPGEENGAVVVRWELNQTYKPQCGISRLQEMRIRDMAARSCEVIRNHAIEYVLSRAGQA
ncbi:hypothetical protein Poli38472_012351 [Pythium oligandrum]|uniref:Uncharacterized protein n=1 Tax=Pythium oligandrum TaxID=41045 RepID=A0A8K1CR67_PYTOL|nr:hypothetical protein Poli38472_012351 [Pythium oligandrum]|eukprot:TMW67235.1 hypothetical protein Poli38472_012351 [Pythium oligandrum]